MCESVLAQAQPSPESAVLTLVAISFGVFALIIFRLCIDRLDRNRIADYVERSGGSMARINWSPFGRGWYGNRGQRIYRVRYTDAEGHTHKAYCKTSMMAGVYFSDDTVIRYQLVDVPADTCSSCGYNLRGNVSGVCPECGEATPVARFSEHCDELET